MLPPPALVTVFETEDQQRGDADHQDRAGDLVPELLPADEVERHLAAVQPAADVTEPGHHASFGVVLAAVAGVAAAPPVADLAVAGLEPRHGDFDPSLAGSRPDHLWPWPKNFVLASRVTIGLVNRNTTTMSIRVVRPSVNAKPLTSPIAMM